MKYPSGILSPISETSSYKCSHSIVNISDLQLRSIYSISPKNFPLARKKLLSTSDYESFRSINFVASEKKNAVYCHSQSPRNRSDSPFVGRALQEKLIKESANGSILSKFHRSFSRPVTTQREEKAPQINDKPIVHQNGKLIDDGMIYRESFVIRCYEVGVNRTASIESIANLLQEIGCNHAQSVGFSTDGFATTPLMRKNRLIWVTTRMHIEMMRYPEWGEAVEIDTWFQSEGQIKSRRDWIIKMADSGEVIGKGTSSWVTMNQDTRRLSKVSPEIQAEYIHFCPDPPRFAFDSGTVSKKVPSMDEPPDFLCSYLRPRRGDLDMNQHVNNVTYIGWMLESIPSKVFEEAELAELTLEYRREVNGGEMVESLASLEKKEETDEGNGAISSHVQNGALVGNPKLENQFIHLLRLQDSKREINRGRTVWRKKSGKKFHQDL